MSRLTSEEQRFLLRLARQSLSHAVALNPAQQPEEIPATLLEFAGVFVSLRKRGELRGCVGFAEARAPLWRAVMEAAAASRAAFRAKPSGRARQSESRPP
jgi:AMMECR1 domain-containing protein